MISGVIRKWICFVSVPVRKSVNNCNIDTYSSTEDSVTGRRITAVTATDTAVTALSAMIWSILKVTITITVTVTIVVTIQRWFITNRINNLLFQWWWISKFWQ